MLKDTDEKINKMRSGRVLSAGDSAPMELGCITSRYVDVFTHLGAYHTVEILWKLPHAGMINY